jgi:hypothetical protein
MSGLPWNPTVCAHNGSFVLGFYPSGASLHFRTSNVNIFAQQTIMLANDYYAQDKTGG